MAIYKTSFTRAQIEEALNRALNVVTEGKSFTLKGEWTSGGSYANSASTIDVVLYDGVSYFCRVTHSGRSTNPKADTTYWGQLAGYEPLIKNVPQEDIDESDTIFFTDASDNGSTKRVTLANFTSKFPSGRGIASIERTSGTGAPGTTDTYTITYTDNNTTTFQIYNGAEGAKGGKGEPGADGADGVDGRPIEFRETSTHIQWRYVGDTTWVNLFALTSLKGDTGSGLEFNWNGTQLGIRVEGETSYQYVNLKGGKGDPGNDGADGKGIVSIARTSGTGAAGTTDTYTVTYTDSTTTTFQIYNGADGQGAGDMTKAVYDPTSRNTDIFGYVDNKVKTVARFVIGTSTAGWTAADCDYLCDGTADQTEINAAITALPATGGEVVILDGTYNITAKIDVTKNNVSIRGNGNATILKRMFDSSVEEGVITLTSRSGCKIANLQIEGNKTSYTNSNNSGIYLNSSSNSTVTGNTCNNNRSSGIYLSASGDNNTITGNTCSNNSTTGIYLKSLSNNTVTGNTCNNNNNRGIYLSASSDNTVTGNTCNNSTTGIYLGSSSDNTVTGNICNNNSSGIYLSYSGSNNTITGNTCNNNSTTGIYLNSLSNSTVTGNTCIRSTGLAADYTASQHTIQLNGTGNSYNLIAMNNCMGKAVTNGGGTGNTLVNNKFDEA